MAEVLYAPNREQVVTTNAWAFLHWLRTTRRVALADWAALQAWSASEPAAFEAAVAAFAGSPLPVTPPARGGRSLEAWPIGYCSRTCGQMTGCWS